MIGVIANPSEQSAVQEFFELFKTPWEWYRRSCHYDAVLSATDKVPDGGSASLVLIYSSRQVPSDNISGVETVARKGKCVLGWEGKRIPIYGDCSLFQGITAPLLWEKDSELAAGYRRPSQTSILIRIGYDLFAEIGSLLNNGQPASNAGIPALELHIELLRALILSAGLPLLEIPPVPHGSPFIVCLTHDVDHPSIAHHRWDHTALGLLYRAVIGSVVNLARRRIPLRDLFANWGAALRLPFVYLGVAADFWSNFADRYAAEEAGLASTYFFIPFANRPGKSPGGRPAPHRAAGYGAQEFEESIRRIVAGGSEVGLHGIDAWHDRAAAEEELNEIRRLTGTADIGVRMHWLYFDRESPAILEKAGAAYDSTIGYRDAVGYYTGTLQAYKPLEAERLLELPLHAMDTALFYPTYLGLSSWQASTALRAIVDDAIRFGGCLTINWHDRSLAPERLWHACYRRFIRDLKERDPWFATAGQAARWFQKRRSVVFEQVGGKDGLMRARVTAAPDDHLPDLQLRVYQPNRGSTSSITRTAAALRDSIEIEAPGSAGQSRAADCTAPGLSL